MVYLHPPLKKPNKQKATEIGEYPEKIKPETNQFLNESVWNN